MSRTADTVTTPNRVRRTIARAEREAGVHVETIRYYERLGLIARPPARSGTGYREYPEEAVRRLIFIKRAQQFGFSLKEIAELAGLADADASCDEMCGRMDRKLADLDRTIADLSRMRDKLASLITASPRRGSYEECRVYECLGADRTGGSACDSAQPNPPSHDS